MTSLQFNNKLKSTRNLLIQESRFVTDFADNKVYINEALYRFLGKPDSIGLYFDDNSLLIVPNGIIPIRKGYFDNNYRVQNDRTLMANIRYIFNFEDENSIRRYKLHQTAFTYLFNIAIIKMR